jgi:hypothetical protein
MGGYYQTSSTTTVESATAYAVQIFVPGTGANVTGTPPDRIQISVTPSPGNIVAGIYTDAGGKPGSLVASGTSSGTGVGLTGMARIASGNYWLAVSANFAQGSVANLSSGLPCVAMAHTYDGTLPATWTSSGSCGPLAIYLVGSFM